jgi:hypothetical protein
MAPGSASPSASASASPAAVPGTVPEYYAETTAARAPAYDNPDNITIRDTYTAAVLATVRPPRPYQTFGLVTGTGMPDVWVVGAQPWHPESLDNSAQPVTLLTLTFDPGSKRTTLTRLPVPPVHASPLESPAPVYSGGEQLAAVALSPNGIQVAAVMMTLGAFEVRDYTVTTGAVSTWSQRLTPSGGVFEWQFSLTWLDDSRTLAVGYRYGTPVVASQSSTVLYLDTTRPAGELAAASRRVVLSFPKAKPPATFKGPFPPDGCAGPPVATSDGQTVLCSGVAATPVNYAGATEVGVWVFSARTGKLTAPWNQHMICCQLSAGEFPGILWASSRGQLMIASGMSTAHGGEELFLRTPDGQLRRLPWQGIYAGPDVLPPIEPAVAW